MEEKKKGSLSTVFLVIAISLIVVMGVFMYMQKTEADRQIAELENNASKLQETINNLQGKSDTISNIITDNDETNINENMMPQFETKFYDLKDAAKAYQECKNISNYKEFDYDFDGDGETDKITVQHKTEKVNNGIGGYRESNYYVMKLNGETFFDGTTDYYNTNSIYIVDLNENDKSIEVVVFDEGPSDDPNYTIYTKNGNKMVELKNIGGYPLKTDKQGTVLVEYVYSRAINPEIHFEYYTIQNGKIEVKNIDVEKLKDIEFKTSYLYFSKNYKDETKIFDELGKNDNNIENTLKKLDIEQLNENTTFKIINITNENEYKIYVKLSDGREGYIFHIQWAG